LYRVIGAVTTVRRKGYTTDERSDVVNRDRQPPHSGAGIGAKTLKGAVWAYGSFVGGRLLVLVSTAILARLLNPRDFGTVGFALTFLAFVDTLQGLGLTQALVAYRGQDLMERANTVFIVTVGVGAGMWLVACALGPVAASFFHQPQVKLLMPVLGVNFLIRAIGSTHYALAQRRFDFRARAGAEFADVIVRGGAGIALALAGAGVWSIVLGYVVGTVAMTGAMWISVPWRPKMRPTRRHLDGMIGFGGALATVDIISAVVSNLDYLFVGRILGATALGLYTMGYRLPELIISNLAVIAGLAMFPAFAQVERERLRHVYLVGFRYTIMVSLPVTAGMLLLARPLVLALFGQKWVGAVAPMRMLALVALAITIDIPAGTVYKAVGKGRILLRLSIPKLVLLGAALSLFTRYGIVATAICQAVIAWSFTVIGIGLVWRMLGAGPRRLWDQAWPLLLSVGIMSAVTFALRSLIVSDALQLVVCVPVGAGVYVLSLWRLAPHAMFDVLMKVAPGRFTAAGTRREAATPIPDVNSQAV
jgi:O-antigen/teichoic acid export membrane protein